MLACVNLFAILEVNAQKEGDEFLKVVFFCLHVFVVESVLLYFKQIVSRTEQ